MEYEQEPMEERVLVTGELKTWLERNGFTESFLRTLSSSPINVRKMDEVKLLLKDDSRLRQLQAITDSAEFLKFDTLLQQFVHNPIPESWICPACKHVNGATVNHCEKCYHSQPLPIECQNLRCDECHLQPIHGCYYRCTVRTYYILCPSCESHHPSQPYPMIKLYEANHQKLAITIRFDDGAHFTQTISNTILSTTSATAVLPHLSPPPPPTHPLETISQEHPNIPHLPHLHNHLFPILHNEANIDSFSHLGKSQSKEMASNTINPMITGHSLPPVKVSSFHRHKKPFKEFHPLHKSKQEASNHMMKAIKIVDLEKTLSYWIGFYNLSHDIAGVFKEADLLTVRELGKMWHEFPEGITALVEDIYTDKEERSNLLRALNDAEELFLLRASHN